METEAERNRRLYSEGRPAYRENDIGAVPLARERRAMGTTATTSSYGASDWLDWVRAGLGVFGLFVALGVASLVLAFAATAALKGVNLNDPNQSAAVAGAGLVALLPLIAGPILAAVGGFWAGTRTRDGGEGALGAGLGTLLGLLALGILTAIGYGIGANASGFDLARVNWPAGLYWRPGWTSALGYFGTGAGLVYLVACLLAAGLAAAIAGLLFTRGSEVYERRTTTRGYGRMPRV